MLGAWILWATLVIGDNGIVVQPTYETGGYKIPLITISEKDTDKINNSIQSLGSDAFLVREAATKELEGFGINALPQVFDVMEKTKDLEVRIRCHRVIQQYYNPVIRLEEFGVWSMPKRFRYINGEDIGAIYYEKARVLWNGCPETREVAKTMYGQMHISQLALSLYCLDQLKNSSVDNRNDVLALREECRDLRDKLFEMAAKKRSEGVYHNDPHDQIPGPIEDRTEELSKMQPPPPMEPTLAPDDEYNDG